MRTVNIVFVAFLLCLLKLIVVEAFAHFQNAEMSEIRSCEILLFGTVESFEAGFEVFLEIDY